MGSVGYWFDSAMCESFFAARSSFLAISIFDSLAGFSVFWQLIPVAFAGTCVSTGEKIPH
jgi:hypothetical protein